MSMFRTCQKCFRKESIRYNFGHDFIAERDFHQQEDWCDCGYESAEEMIKDQKMPLTNPKWILLAKYFLNEYHLRIGQGNINDCTELVRLFLMLLKNGANNVGMSIDLVRQEGNEKFEFDSDFKTKKKPRTDIFNDHSMDRIKMELFVAKIRAKNANENSIPPKAKRNRRILWGIAGLIVGLIIGKWI